MNIYLLAGLFHVTGFNGGDGGDGGRLPVFRYQYTLRNMS